MLIPRRAADTILSSPTMDSKWVARQVRVATKFRKRTKAVSLLSEEHYLRDDIPCGVQDCPSGCQQESPPLSRQASHYLIPDAQAVLDYQEILELPQLTGVIYLASVIKDVLQKVNQRKFPRLKSLYSDRRRQSSFFDDQHCLYTSLTRQDYTPKPDVTSPTTRVPHPVTGGQDRGIPSKTHGLDPSIQAAAAWFAEHLQQRTLIVVLSDQLAEASEGVRQRLLRAGVQVLSGSEYFHSFWRQDAEVLQLFEALVHSRTEATEALPSEPRGAIGRGTSYPPFLPAHAIEDGLSDGTVRVGVFQVSRQAPDEAFVRPSNKGEASRHEIFIPGRRLQNRALQGDLVAVRLLPREQWRSPRVGRPRGSHVAEAAAVPSEDPILGPEEEEVEAELETGPEETGSEDEAPGEGAPGESSLRETVTGERTGNSNAPRVGVGTGERGEKEGNLYAEGGGKQGERVPTGEVVGIVQRAARDYVACLQKDDEESLGSTDSGRTEAVLAVPMNRRIPFVRLRTRQVARLAGQRFVVRIDGWERDTAFPHGHVARLVGSIGDLKAESESLLVENGIEVAPFSSGALQELPPTPWSIPRAEVAARRDLRHDHRACSIDPPGSKDVDDVLSVKWLPDGTAEVGVHIADVSYFVRHDSLLDLEARARGTTVYLVDRRFDMLPKLLAEDLCSLVGGQDRLAVSVVWHVDPSEPSIVGRPWFGRTVIHNRHQLSYPQAQAILDGRDSAEVSESERGLLQVDLSLLAALSRALRARREAAGALELASAELRFETDAATGAPMKVITKQELQVNWVVAELMIAANSAVAERIFSAFPSTSLLRHHAPPRPDGFDRLQECFEAYGLAPLDISSNRALAQSLDRTRALDPTVQNALRAIATRAMSEAQYICTGAVRSGGGSEGLSGFYHYGLALEFYTHFTSPIRRYADVLVHRQLIAALENGGSRNGLESGSLGRIAEPVRRGLVSAPKLEEIADHLNERHRASKRAQKDCSELYLLLYLRNHTSAEKAIVTSVHAHGVMVFVPRYDLRGPVYLRDKAGKLLPPSDGSENGASGTAHWALQKEGNRLKVSDVRTGEVVHSYGLMQAVWVELRADGSRSHVPTLKIRLLTDSHPAVRAAAAAEAEADFLSRYGGSAGALPRGRGPAAGTRAAAIAAMGREVARTEETAKAEQMKRDEEMARALQALEVGAAAGGQPPRGKRPKERQSVHDVIENFKRLVIEGERGSQELSLEGARASTTELSVGIHTHETTRLRRRLYLLQRRASQARAKRIRSILADTDSRQKQREARELKARVAARTMVHART